MPIKFFKARISLESCEDSTGEDQLEELVAAWEAENPGLFIIHEEIQLIYASNGTGLLLYKIRYEDQTQSDHPDENGSTPYSADALDDLSSEDTISSVAQLRDLSLKELIEPGRHYLGSRSRELAENLNRNIDSLGLSGRALKPLQGHRGDYDANDVYTKRKIVTVLDLIMCSEELLLDQVERFGRTGLREVRKALEAMGLSQGKTEPMIFAMFADAIRFDNNG